MEVQYRHFLNEFCREVVDLVIEVLKGLRTLAAPETACSRVRTVSFVPIEVMCNFASSFGENVSSQRGNRTASLPATTLSTETHSSTTVVTTLERAFNLDTCTICLFLSRDGERRPECRKVQCHHFSMGLVRQEIAIVSENKNPVHVDTNSGSYLTKTSCASTCYVKDIKKRHCDQRERRNNL